MRKREHDASICKVISKNGQVHKKTIKKKIHYFLMLKSSGFYNIMVEVTGIEPVSESALTETSPGADGHLHSLILPQAVMLQDLVASSCVVRAKLTVRTFTTGRRRIPDRGPSGYDAG